MLIFQPILTDDVSTIPANFYVLADHFNIAKLNCTKWLKSLNEEEKKYFAPNLLPMCIRIKEIKLIRTNLYGVFVTPS